MRKWQGFKLFGCLVVATGVIIVLTIVLPSSVWWFILGLALICGGFCLMRK